MSGTFALKVRPALAARRSLQGLEAKVGLARFLVDPVAELTRLSSAGNGAPVISSGGRHDWVLALGARANRELLNDTDAFHMNPNPYPFVIEPGTALHRLNQALVYVDGDAHKRQRASIAPALRPKFLADQFALVGQEVGALADRWAPGAVVDVGAAFRALTLRISQRSLFGRSQETGEGELGRCLETYVQSVSSPGVFLLPYDVPLSPLRTLYARARRVETAVRGMIAERRAQGPGTDLMSILIYEAEGSSSGDDELIGNLVVLFLASHETSCQALTWALFLLSQHPSALHDLRDELDAALGGAPPTDADLPRLPLLERTVKEVLRILSPIVYMLRVAARDTSLAGRPLAAGTRVVWSPYITHRLPELYEEPKRFRPRRWEGPPPPAYAYVPFGAGAHACVGGSFAMGELMIALAMLVQRFGFELLPGARVDRRVHLTLLPKEPLRLRIRGRDEKLTLGRPAGNIREMVEFD